MLRVSDDRSPRDGQRDRSSRRSVKAEQYQLLHTTLLVLGVILFIAAVIVTVVTVLTAVL